MKNDGHAGHVAALQKNKQGVDLKFDQRHKVVCTGWLQPDDTEKDQKLTLFI